ncbi:MAG: hypothetical protein JWM36_3025, partial [Hyphomicrobiales bacterium]|nr:hypothetical protein [Hyphomicrobiales bacterium]
LGTKVMQTYSNQDLIDPQGPAHAVTADMNGEFFMFAKDQDSPKVWYDSISLNDFVV